MYSIQNHNMHKLENASFQLCVNFKFTKLKVYKFKVLYSVELVFHCKSLYGVCNGCLV